MDRQRNLQPQTRRAEADDPNSVEPEAESSLLREALGWSGIAREAHARIESDQTADILGVRRRNGPGQ
jgi:hypothetical protein